MIIGVGTDCKSALAKQELFYIPSERGNLVLVILEMVTFTQLPVAPFNKIPPLISSLAELGFTL